MKMLIFSLLLPLLLGSCAPKVLTHIEKKYPSRVVADEVHLYGVGQTVPETAERIGSVRVVDGGASTKCNYEQVVALAKQETAKSSGNALALTDHRKPSLLGSSCHQIAGDMLWIGDTANWETGTVADLSAPVGDKNTTGVAKSAFRHSTFYANVGYAFITSKYYLPSGASGNPKNGMDWQLGYDWVSRSGFGAGLMYSGYKSSYAYSNVDVKVGLAYVAPQFVMKQKVGCWGKARALLFRVWDMISCLERNIICLIMSGSEQTLDTSAALCRSRTMRVMEMRSIPESFVCTLTPEYGFISDGRI